MLKSRYFFVVVFSVAIVCWVYTHMHLPARHPSTHTCVPTYTNIQIREHMHAVTPTGSGNGTYTHTQMHAYMCRATGGNIQSHTFTHQLMHINKCMCTHNPTFTNACINISNCTCRWGGTHICIGTQQTHTNMDTTGRAPMCAGRQAVRLAYIELARALHNCTYPLWYMIAPLLIYTWPRRRSNTHTQSVSHAQRHIGVACRQGAKNTDRHAYIHMHVREIPA